MARAPRAPKSSRIILHNPQRSLSLRVRRQRIDRAAGERTLPRLALSRDLTGVFEAFRPSLKIGLADPIYPRIASP